MTDLLAENSPFNMRVWQLQWTQFHDPKLNAMFIKHFLEFTAANNSLLWQMQVLQRRLMQDNLGVKYWEAKIEQFRVLREGLQLKLL